MQGKKCIYLLTNYPIQYNLRVTDGVRLLFGKRNDLLLTLGSVIFLTCNLLVIPETDKQDAASGAYIYSALNSCMFIFCLKKNSFVFIKKQHS